MLLDRRASRPPLLPPSLPPRARDDACFTGCGLAGLLAAALLARDGRHVRVLEPEAALRLPELPIASGLVSGFLDIEREHGARGARFAARRALAAIDAVEALVRRERIACDFERLDGYRFAGPEESLAGLRDEAAAAQRAGIPDAEVRDAPIEGSDAACLHCPGQAQLHAPRFVAGLLRALARDGVPVHFGASGAARPGTPCVVETACGARIETDLAVTAVRRPQAAPRATVALRLPRGAISRALYWERTPAGWLAARLQALPGHGDALLVEGPLEAHALEAWARHRYPRAKDVLYTAAAPATAAWPDLVAFCAGAADASESAFISAAGADALLTRAATAALAVKQLADAMVPAMREDAPA